MKNLHLLTATVFFTILVLLGSGNAHSKAEDNQFSYIKMPTGKYYKLPREKEALGAETINCIAFSKFPEQYYGRAPWYCVGHTAAAAIMELTTTIGKNPAKLIVSPSGMPYQIGGELQGEDLLCKIKNDLPDVYNEYREYFTDNASCSAFKVDLNSALAGSASSMAIRFGAAVAVFLLISIGLIRKPRDTLLKQGRWFSAIGAAIAVAIVSQGRRSFDDYLYILSINLFIYASIGFLSGVVWFKVTELPKTKPNQPDTLEVTSEDKPTANTGKENVILEDVLRELESGARDELLWAKSVVAADGDMIKAKAEYIRQRLTQLSEPSVSEDPPK